ncbi:hypothetical protein Rsub_11564 [Raphidocelis subcapitata]|uniref:TOG domain-containing protein n=1 Tax=Raphidocelis subcapitata TaxID=307507 RepID=A0A2V0PGJ5_9CHLO|nr:hypothetical protein Rsub_11564 [Raphidocelis subcapitata]|eukprot:GBF98978.1 hypothetical protein Rsub_11564 [Raphidocelis subcapitata]
MAADFLSWEQLPEGAGKESPGQQLKSEEEISRYAVDEKMPELDRALLFLRQGYEVQQRKAIDSLAALVRARGRAAFDALRGPLEAALDALEDDAEVAAAEAWATVARERLMPPQDLAECLLPPALAALRDGPEGGAREVCDAWLAVLLELLPVLPREATLSEVVPLALAKGQVDCGVASRVLCCRLLGALTPWLGRADVEAGYATKVVALCQDTDYQVRVAACQQLPALARCLGDDGLKGQLLGELTQLLEDEEPQVRAAALATLADAAARAGPELRRAALLPLVRRHMQPLELEPPVQRALAGLFPALMEAVHAELAPGDVALFYGCFRHLAARPDAALRRAAAGALPRLMAAPLPGATAAYLADTWADLAADCDDEVRARIAASMPQLPALLGPTEAGRLLRRPLAAALGGGAGPVRDAALAGLADVMGALFGMEEPQREALGADLHCALVTMRAGLGCNWRAQLALARAFPAFPALLPGDAVHDQWTPYAMGLLVSGAHRVKPAAAAGLAAFLRAARRDRQRTETFTRCVRELARGRGCWARLGFLQFAAAAARRFSARFFKSTCWT